MKTRTYAILLIFSVLACKDKEQTDNAVSGKLNVLADESFISIVNAEKKVFEYLYKDVAISSSAISESEAIANLIEGKTDMAVVSRTLTEKEKATLKRINVIPDSYKIASDGIVLIVHKERIDSSITSTQLQDILNGKILQWKDMEGKEGGPVLLAFDLKNSSTILYVNQKFPLNTQKIQVLAAGSNRKVIEYVQTHKDAIGFIGLSLLSDDPGSNEHLKNINVLSIDGYSPWQEDLATEKYPLKRDIILLNRYKSGLGTGFASFILSEDGQRIILKAGLLPVKMPGREVIFN